MSRSALASNWYLSSAGQRAVDPKNTHNKHKGKYHKSYLSVGCHRSISFGGLSQVYAFENNMSSHNHQRAVTETRIYWFQPADGCQSVGGSKNAHVNKNITDDISARQMSGSAGTCPHDDRYFNMKGRGPVSISTDLKAVSVKHRLLYMSTSIEYHCCTQSRVVNLGVGKSVICMDHFRIPVANVLWPLTME